MATFAPSSNLYVLNVPFDITYRNQMYFTTEKAQYSWFAARISQLFANFLVIRKTMPDGSMRSSVKVESNIDTLYGTNYIMYQNANHGNKWFYAFITKLIYINEETTEIVFETDVWQTWMFDVSIRDSFVVREHCETDYLGEHRIGEPFQCSDYTYSYVDDIFTLTSWGYLVALSNPRDISYEGEYPRQHSGIYQGLYFYFFAAQETTQMGVFLAALEEDSVQFIAIIPRFCLSNAKIGPTDANPNVSKYYVQETTEPAFDLFSYNFDITTALFEGYKPKNNKMYTSPYINLLISKHTGDAVVLNVEDFDGPGFGLVELNMYGDISASPSVMVYPRNYRGIPHNIDCGFTIRDFAQCSTSNDAFKLWWARNGESIRVNELRADSQIGLGALAFAGGSFTPLAAGGGAMLAGGSQQIINGVLQHMQNNAAIKAAEHQANRATMGNPSKNLLTAIGWNRFSLYKRSLRKDNAKSIDDFFTMYGYQINKVKRPNLNSRPYFNYVQTKGANVIAKPTGLPNDDLSRIVRMFDEGVTLWKPDAIIGDYSVDNSPTYV